MKVAQMSRAMPLYADSGPAVSSPSNQRAGDVAQAKSRLAALRKRFPANTLLINYWVPTVPATTR
jgi:hypothetical protein